MSQTPITAKLMTSASTKRAVDTSKDSKHTTSHEMEPPPTSLNTPLPKKRKHSLQPPALDTGDSFEALTSDVSGELNMLSAKFSQFTKVLSERAAADTSQMTELEDILKNTRHLESDLQEKKQHLRQTLALISDKLQG